MITILDTTSWGQELITGNAEFVETTDDLLYVVSNVRNNGFGYGRGFGNSFGSQYQFVVLESDPVPPAPGPGSSFGATPPVSVPVATYTFPQPTTSFDPVCAYDETSGLLHILGSRNTPTGSNTSSVQTNDLIKFTYDTVGHTLSGPFVIGASVGSRVRGAYDIAILPSGNTIVAAAFTDPAITSPPLTATITAVAVTANIVTVTVNSMPTPFLSNQWVLIDGLKNASFLNGAVIQVQLATATSFTGVFVTPNYPNTPETSGTASAVGSSLFAVELDKTTNLPVANTAQIIVSSPSRSGNTYDGVSLAISNSAIGLYFLSHPKQVTFKDQIFSVNYIKQVAPYGYNFGYNFGTNTQVWDEGPTVLYTFAARYTDSRLTVVQDGFGNSYLSLTYWTQLNHPEGIVGNVLTGVQQGSQPWFFHPTLGSTATGSIIQSSLSVARNGQVTLTYLLQPFDPITNPPGSTSASWPLQVASVDPTTLDLTNQPGFYNTLNLTWLRGTKSLIDDSSLWALVGEQEVTSVSNEVHVVPSHSPYTVLINYSSSFFENVSVVYYPSLVPLTQVATNPKQGQYTVDESIGLYMFNIADAAQALSISYEYISSIVPTYASLFNVPPIAKVQPTAATTYRNGTFYATDVATITSFSIASNVLTVTCANDFVSGQKIAFYGFDNPSNKFLNGTAAIVATASSTQFTASYTHGNYSSVPDTGFAAHIIPGLLNLSAAGSTDADQDALQYIWTENDPNLVDVFLTTSGANATVNVLGGVGPAEQIFDVGVAVIDLFPDLVTQRHPALILENIQVASGVLTITVFAPPGAVIPITGEQVMLYDVVLGAPPAPVLSTVAGGTLPVQGAPGFGYQFGAMFGILQPISVVITYVNALGETIGSANTTIASVSANHLLEVISPVSAGGAGDATGYNVYVGTVGNETLQPDQFGVYIPTPLGTNWIEPTTGFTSISTKPPLMSGAVQEFLNDQILTLTAATPGYGFNFGANFGVIALTANISLGFGYDYGFDFGVSSFPLTTVTGYAITQFQFAETVVTVPQNVAPIATFPAPQWDAGNVLAMTIPRNTKITITPGTITDPTTQFPVIYTGVTDPDDVPTYQWAQISGTPVVLPDGSTSPSVSIDTNGVNLNGETLGFSLTVNDGINPPFTTNFSINVVAYQFDAANLDTLQVARSVYSTSATVTNVSIVDGIGTFMTPNNIFTAGQRVWFEGMAASFLNGGLFTVLPTGYGTGFGAGFGTSSLSTTQFQVYSSTLSNYGPAADSGTAYSSLPISQRNADNASSWSPLDISIFFNNLRAIKRHSVLDGSDRYILISPYSVLVYGVFPSATPAAVLLRKIFLPDPTGTILDAVHTEQDYTLVLDAEGNIYRYSQGPFINTDDPDTVIRISDYTSLSFADTDLANDVHILTTVSFGNSRVVVLSGEQGAVLLQMNTTTLAVTGKFELTVESNFVYGADKVQFVRWVDMDNLTSGRILLGTVLNNSAEITNIQIASDTLTVTCKNTFLAGDTIVLSGLTTATFLNGLTVTVTNATASHFTTSLAHADYASAADTGLAQSQFSGSTYETLIDLTAQQIIGTFDKSKLRNQFVETGEIMFDPDDPYAGGPTAPVLLPITTAVLGGNTNVVISWQMVRPDLINSYTIQVATITNIGISVPASAPYTYQVPSNYDFTGDEGVHDGTTNASLQSTGQTSPLTGQYNASSTGLYTFNQAQAGHNVAISVRGAFSTFQIVNEGSVTSILATLPAGATYFFRVEASGLDGTSGFSNIQSITI